ncbi:MAG TPA: MarR family transcriptional regulator [Steroidobacteraceae bacterium]|jgi:DNA-binding MarR family transcriptional regulator|nr:MarR family transcriptional regulator [Steroidobacteraceae bacterium]
MQHYTADKYRAKTSVGYLVKRANALVIEGLEPALAEQGFTFTQWVVMMHVRDGLAPNAKDICVQLRHDSGAVTRILDQLEARALLVRERSLDDRREVKLRLTQAGHQMVESLIPTVVNKLNAVLIDFSSAEVTELTRLLNKFIAGLNSANSARPGEAA